MPENPRWFSPPAYGMASFGDVFTNRQLLALSTFSDLVDEVRELVKKDAAKAGLVKGDALAQEGRGALAYADAISVYLAFQIDQEANHLSTVCAWHVNNEQLKNTFARQALPMTWDFAEVNPFSNSTGCLENLQERQVKAFASLAGSGAGRVLQANAAQQTISDGKIISTDPRIMTTLVTLIFQIFSMFGCENLYA